MTNISNLNSYISLNVEDVGLKPELPRFPVVSDATRAIYKESSDGNRVIPDLRAAFEELANSQAHYDQKCKAHFRANCIDFSIVSGLAAGVVMVVNSLFKAVILGLSTPVALSLALPFGITCGLVYMVKFRSVSPPSDYVVANARNNALIAIKNFEEVLKWSSQVIATIDGKLKKLSSESEKKIYTTAIEEIRAAYGYCL